MKSPREGDDEIRRRVVELVKSAAPVQRADAGKAAVSIRGHGNVVGDGNVVIQVSAPGSGRRIGSWRRGVIAFILAKADGADLQVRLKHHLEERFQGRKLDDLVDDELQLVYEYIATL